MTEFGRDAGLEGNEGLGAGRQFEQSAKEKREAVDGTRKDKPQPRTKISRPGGRASLVERNNPEEALVFHWDPTSYRIGKTSKWVVGESTSGGTDTLKWTGTTPTIVSFTLLLNDIGQPADNQPDRTVEQSLEWLMERTRARTETDVARQGPGPRKPSPWLSARDIKAGKSPPVLILFGMRDGFECVLSRMDIKTLFQRGPFDGPAGGPTERAQQKAARSIVRATVKIELKEYVLAPDAGES